MRFGWFPIIILFPIRCIAEIIEGYADILCLFKFKNKKVWRMISLLEGVVSQLRNLEPLDLIEIRAKGHKVDLRLR